LYRSAWNPAALEAWTEVLVQAAIASTASSTTPTNLDNWIVEPESKAAQLGPSLLPILEWLHSHSSTNTDVAVSMLQHAATVAVASPSFLAGNAHVLATCIRTSLQVATSCYSADERAVALALAALQVLASLISVGDVKRRYLSAELATAVATTALPLCVRIMADHSGDPDDDKQWAETPATLVQEGMDDEETDEYLFAVMLLESFLSHLGALSVVLPLAESLLHDARRARVGLAILECAVAATPVALTPHLPVVLQAATTLSTAAPPNHPPRTRYQALRLLGTLGQTHAAEVRASAPAILEALARALGDTTTTTKVSVVASLGLVSFCRGGGDDKDSDPEQISECLAPFVSDLLQALIQGPLALAGTDGGSIAVRVRAIGATACLAQASGGEAFTPYYSRILPGLLATAQLPVVDLAGAAIEAATIIGQAVGKEIFQSDAHQLLQWILPALQQPSESPLLDSLLLACARIASVLEEDFAPFVDAVVPLLLRRVQAPPDVSIVVSSA